MLAVAESAFQFEHRDLHWGNVLLRPTKAPVASFCLAGIHIQVPTHGVEVVIIDFTASRLATPQGGVAFCDLATDPELFTGPRGNVQVRAVLG